MYSVMETAIEPQDLERTIDELKARIKRHGRYLRKNETRTRQVLIDPLLRELGWDVEDPDSVQLEFKGKNGQPDYALVSGGVPVAVIEAKRLGVEFETAEGQVIKYTTDPMCRQIKLVAFTDGDDWALWRASNGWEYESVRVSDRNSYKTADQMIGRLDRVNFRKGVGRSAVRSAPATGDWYPLDAPMPSGTNPPTAIRFADGTMQAVKFWNDTHVAVASHLFGTGALTRAMVPLRSPRGSRYLVAKSPRHADGKQFRNEKEFADSLWLDGSGGARWTLTECAELIEACGEDPGTVEVRFD